jgi:hypothetical protein
MDYLELSVLVGNSGKFIQLWNSGALEKAQQLWARYCRLRKRLELNRAKLCKCNDALWLFRYSDQCRRHGKNFEEELQFLVDGLEKERGILEEKEKVMCSQLEQVDPTFFQVCHTLAGARWLLEYGAASIGAQTLIDYVLKRRAIIARYPHLDSFELCLRFDLENLPVPEDWTAKFCDVNSWETAYKNKICRNRIHKMISQDKRQLRLP